MQTSFLSLLTLAAGAFAGTMGTRDSTYGVVAERSDMVPVSLATITASIQVFTASINATIAALPVEPSEDDITVCLSVLTPDFDGISGTLQAAIDVDVDVLLDIDVDIDITVLVLELVLEITATINLVIAKLGLIDGLLLVVKPLIVLLGNLCVSIDVVVAGLYIKVQALVDLRLGVVADVLVALLK